METIIGLLFILLPVVFKLIEKKLQNSGHTEAAGKVREILDQYMDETAEEDETVSRPVEPVVTQPEKEVRQTPVFMTESFPQVSEACKVKPTVRAKKKKTSPIYEEKQNIEKKDKIDPRKLVIYSEIMKPKYEQ